MFNPLQRWSDNPHVNLNDIGLTTAITNKEQTVYDVWDGYNSNLNFTKFDSLGNPSNPIVLGGGDTPSKRS